MYMLSIVDVCYCPCHATSLVKLPSFPMRKCSSSNLRVSALGGTDPKSPDRGMFLRLDSLHWPQKSDVQVVREPNSNC